MHNDVVEPPSEYRSITDVLAVQVSERPEATFLRYRDQTYSYAEVDHRSNAIANELNAQGIESGDVVCLYLYNSPEFLFCLFALAKLGAVAAPIDTRFKRDSLAHILSETEADTLVFGANTRTAYEEVRHRIPSITTEYYVGPVRLEHPYRRFDELLEGSVDRPVGGDVDGSDPFTITYIQRYASEHPKGVVLPHFSYVNTGWECAHNLFGFSGSDCIFTTLPLYSSYPLQIGMTGAMVVGAEFAFAKRFRPELFWEQTREHGATVFLYLDRMLSVLYNRGIEAETMETPVTLALGHGFGFETDENIIDRFEQAFDLTVLEGYGVTATATIATFNRPEDRRVGSVGRPVSHAEIEIVDENDWPVEPGNTGEIVVRSTRPNAMIREYYRNPEATVDVCRNQWIHTNDIGYVDEEGYLFFIASQENTIYRGRVVGRISALEIESIINAHPDVVESAVVGVTNEIGEEEIKAAVVPREDASLTPVEVCQHCEKRLAYLKVPRYIEVRSELPRSPSGKIQKSELRAAHGRKSAWDRESGYELSR